jgi:hypothetical protein
MLALLPCHLLNSSEFSFRKFVVFFETITKLEKWFCGEFSEFCFRQFWFGLPFTVITKYLLQVNSITADQQAWIYRWSCGAGCFSTSKIDSASGAHHRRQPVLAPSHLPSAIMRAV